jgi:hypothetical protein
LQEELCARIPEADKKSLRIALGLENDEAMTRMQTKTQEGSVIFFFQEDENEDPFAPKSRNIFKERWDDLMGSIYSWYYSISGAKAPQQPAD